MMVTRASRDLLDAPLRSLLERFRDHGSPTGSVLINLVSSGCVDLLSDVPPTPPSNAERVGERTAMAAYQAAINRAIGEMVAYEAEGGGALFQDMVPCLELSCSQTSLGSSVPLEIHTEQAFSDLRPDFLSLACLRGDPDAKTYTLHVRQILDCMDEREASLLREPLWTVGVDASFVASGLVSGAVRGPVPIVSGPEDDPTLVFDQDLMRGVTAEAEALRRKVVDVYHARRHEHVLGPGDVMIVDNRRAVHGRSSFSPRFDGTDRFIVRSFVVRDLSASEHAREGRTVMASFS